MVSSGGEPFAVAVGEVVVGSSAEFEFADPGWPDPEVFRGRGEGEVLGSAGWSEVAVVGHGAVPGECLEDLACDGAFERAEHGFDRPSLREVSVAIGAGGRIEYWRSWGPGVVRLSATGPGAESCG